MTSSMFSRLRQFLLRQPQPVAGSYVARLADAPPLSIDTDVTPAQRERLLASTADVWAKLGEAEPHWSVLTSPEYKRSAVTATELERFFESGGVEYQIMARAFARAGHALEGLSSVLEIGCGVGRITGWLAQHHGDVVAVDISQAHLAVARDHLSDLGCSNVELAHIARLQDIDFAERFDLVFSVIVLQHNPPPVIMDMLARCIQSLKPGGYAFFQVPTYIFDYGFDAAAYVPNPQEMEMHCVPLPVLLDFLARAGCRVLDLFEDDYPGHPSIVSHTFLVRKDA